MTTMKEADASMISWLKGHRSNQFLQNVRNADDSSQLRETFFLAPKSLYSVEFGVIRKGLSRATWPYVGLWPPVEETSTTVHY